MNWFSSLSVRAKLLLSFVVVCLITGIVGGVGVTKLGQVNDMLTKMYEKELKGTSYSLQISRDIAAIGREARQAFLVADIDAVKKIDADIDARVKVVQETLDTVKDCFTTPEGKALVEKAKEQFTPFYAKASEGMDYLLQSKEAEAKTAINESRAFAIQLNVTIDELVKRKANDASSANTEGDRVYTSSRTLLLSFIGGGVLLGLALGYFIARWFTKAILEVDEISVAVAAASQQLAAASEQLSTGTQESASSLEETAASLEEITATVKQNADNADQANQLANSSRETAEKGGTVVGNAVRAMSEINQASKKIADIITTIDEIAFQTNLLALNAAVEAARAGEQGRGFAVVAGEVRNLAQRSATAAKEIKRLIEDSVQKVEVGSQYVNQSGETLEGIVTSVKRVTDIVAEIAAASREQSAGIEQVNRAMTQLDQVTQANASQTEEMSGTAVALSGQAEQLKMVVAQFNVSKNEQAGKSTPKSTARPALPRPSAMPTTTRGSTRPATSKKVTKQSSKHELDRELVGAGAGRNVEGFEEF
ncbi:MAG TPA: methyl-accepting chemotaxis protein [Pirellulaceae bacterium]|nr:methyl-accepting chemotaxis protein [Pirellulaceae bacterium]